MAVTCSHCNQMIVWIKRGNGTYMPPFEPTLEFATGEYVLIDGDGNAIPMPQVYKRHRCDSDPWAGRNEPTPVQTNREDEREVMLAYANRLRAEQEEAEREAEERERVHRLAEIRRGQRERALRHFPEWAMAIYCTECGAAVGEPCLNLQHKSDEIGQPWYNERTPHASRMALKPLTWSARVPWPYGSARLWGDDYEGPWPPDPGDTGYKPMRAWLMENPDVFASSDEHRIRDFVTPVEAARMAVWLRANYHCIFDKETDATTEEETHA